MQQRASQILTSDVEVLIFVQLLVMHLQHKSLPQGNWYVKH